ncbi:mediator complex subunit MED17 [Toxoplasma gondii ME49]|uniref:Mediator complex subunit MED17 n=3 Tax=Toxoplasma gondii TaxID=5811 RepID=B6KGN8_TOXGV|nr:mediator complex subunit MED17 [Toxoplasma gondii ME49]EPT24828.1 mediator complex subunit MED17 [Toxoplasma gondii ME49]ESS34236.1 mediator complex subunit MED17 [Toxoplasma gondii VEG]KFG47048.1 mediator complex subunit MED17 [Toxoplasma gondii GAB2-2007-GAL-DOM2]CEL78301.1 TPA: mediator complex subunit MED17 [Toxoplasma gondii VEG]|eukprot:XP_002367011.1 mediator complex subunit MED17 [Toxoplasma gondii ME49]
MPDIPQMSSSCQEGIGRAGKREATVDAQPVLPSRSSGDASVPGRFRPDKDPSSVSSVNLCPQFSLEPYGAGDLRLLKFLADGRPVWEAPPARPPSGQIAADVDFFFPEKDVLPAPVGATDRRTVETPQSVSLGSSSSSSASSCAAAVRQTVSESGGEGAAGEGQLLGRESASAHAARAEAFRAYLEKSARASAAYPPSDLLQRAEALCVAADARHQEQLKESDPWVKNKGVWEEAVQKRDEASKWLSGAGMLFDLLLGTANAAPSQRFLRLVEAKDEVDEEEMWQKLLIGLQGRREMSVELEKEIANARHQMLRTPAGLPGQRTWVQLLRRLQRLRWVLVKKRYQDVEFSQSDASYPYVSEVYIHLLQIPTRCWGAGTAAPVGCSLPLPPPRVFGDHFVLLKATLKDPTEPREEGGTCGGEPATPGAGTASAAGSRDVPASVQRRTASPWGFVLEYDEQAASAVETRALLHVNVRPLLAWNLLSDSRDVGDSSTAVIASRAASWLFPNPSTCLPPPAGLLVDELPAMNPPPLTDRETKQDAEVAQASNAIHRRLQQAQWCLLDRCCFHVLAAQAERMRVLGEQNATASLQKSGDIPFGGEKAGGGDADVQCLRRRITAECIQVDSKRIRILLRGVPISLAQAGVPETGTDPSGAGGVFSARNGLRSKDVANSAGVAMSETSGMANKATIHTNSAIPGEQMSNSTCKCGVHTLDFVVDVAYLPTDLGKMSEEAGVCCRDSKRGSSGQRTAASEDPTSSLEQWRTEKKSEASVNRSHEHAEDSAPLASASVFGQKCSLCRCCTVRLHEEVGAFFEQAQRVAVLQLRQFFLEAWAYEAFERPKLCGELAFAPPLLDLAGSRTATRTLQGSTKAGCSSQLRGEHILRTFVSWLASEGLDFV